MHENINFQFRFLLCMPSSVLAVLSHKRILRNNIDYLTDCHVISIIVGIISYRKKAFKQTVWIKLNSLR